MSDDMKFGICMAPSSRGWNDGKVPRPLEERSFVDVTKNIRRQVDILLLEQLDELRADARRPQLPDDLAALVQAGLLEGEHVLQHDDIALHPLHLGDISDLAATVLEARLLDDQVHRRRDLLADGTHRQGPSSR